MPKLYDPTATPKQAAAVLAARLPDLRGKTVGLLDISKAKGNFFPGPRGRDVDCAIPAAGNYPAHEAHVCPSGAGRHTPGTGTKVRLSD